MANNRMYLVNKKDGKSVLLAKFYPSTGWYVPDPKLIEKLSNLFDEYTECSNWQIEYEVQPDEATI